MANKPFNKLEAKYIGPYPIDAKVGVVAYKLLLSVDVVIHSIVHVSYLRKGHKMHSVINHPPILKLFSPYCPIPKVVLERRLVRKGDKVVTQVLIKWFGIDAQQVKWEYFTDM